MYSIHIANQQRVLRLNRPRLVRLAGAALAAEQVASAEISIALVDDARIHEFNRRYLGHDYATDVLSFLLESERNPRRTRGPEIRNLRKQQRTPVLREPRGAGKALEGEIIISAETTVRTAAEIGWPPGHELSLYLVHGLLHLCGYDDLTPAQRRIMRAREIEVLEPWKIVPRYAA